MMYINNRLLRPDLYERFDKTGLIWFMIFVIFCACEPHTDQNQTEPDHPVASWLAEPHPAYSYDLVHTGEDEGYTTYIFRMISQHWLNEELVDEPEWWHWITMVVPDQLEHSTALLWIGGGTHYSDMPEKPGNLLIQTALETGSIAIDLHNIPFQPVRFTGDTLDQRYEDDLIAFGWREFMESGAGNDHIEWLARLPMTAAAMRAMDTVTEFTNENIDVPVEDFVVAGASKRGWTTWYAGIFDERVIAIAPAVIDLLNMLPSFDHHWQAYGEWSPAIREYENEGIMQWQFSSEYERLRELVDPYSYLEHLTMPKFIINAASDEFFLPDSWQFYWDELPGQKYLRYIPNTGHSLSDTDAVESLISFHNHIINNFPMPLFNWRVENGQFYIQTDPDYAPDEIRMWQAHNPDGRDFRLYVINQSWESEVIPLSADGDYSIELDEPSDGYKATFVEAVFPGTSNLSLKLTTGIVILPDNYPFEAFETDSPRGTVTD